MCEANVYLIDKEGREKLLLDSVDKLIPTGDAFILENIYNQRKIVKAKIKEMSLVSHRIVLEEILAQD